MYRMIDGRRSGALRYAAIEIERFDLSEANRAPGMNEARRRQRRGNVPPATRAPSAVAAPR